MNAIRDWAAIICMAALAASLIQYLSPSGSMERVMKMVLGAFLVCSILLPLTKAVPQFALEIPASAQVSQDGYEFKDKVDQQLYEAAKSGISGIVARELYSMNINYENVELMMDTNEDNSIVINKVVVTLDQDSQNRCAEAAARLEKATGLQMEVTTYGG